MFAADSYGAEYRDVGQDGGEHDVVLHSREWMIDRFFEIRRRNAHGDQYDYFDDPSCAGWTRLGDEHHPDGWGAFPCAPGTVSAWAPEDGR